MQAFCDRGYYATSAASRASISDLKPGSLRAAFK